MNIVILICAYEKLLKRTVNKQIKATGNQDEKGLRVLGQLNARNILEVKYDIVMKIWALISLSLRPVPVPDLHP